MPTWALGLACCIIALAMWPSKDKAKAKAERAKKRDDEKLAEQRSLCPAGKKRVKKKEDDEIVVTY